MIWELIIEALTTLRTNLLRTILTMTGIILGVAAVIAIMTLGQSAYSTAEAEIMDSGYGNIKIYGQNSERSIPLNQNVINILTAAQIDQVTGFESQFYGLGSTAYTRDDDSLDMRCAYQDVRSAEKMTYLAGYSFSQEDLDDKSQVAIIDQYTAEKLFGSITAALGESLRLSNGNFYRIIGVVKNENFFSSEIGRMYLPKSLGETEPFFQSYGYSYLDVNLALGADYAQVTQDIKDALMEAYGFTDEDEMVFSVENVKDVVGQISTFMTAFSVGLALIAAISLLVGGVGIMNIMLVNVTERTREIGLMKALGAQEKDITFQFLVEAVVMTICGGALGVILGLGGSYLVIWVANTFIAPMGIIPEFEFVISQMSIVVSVAVSVAIGLIFGAYPAKRAAKLDPVEALRHD